MLRMAVAFLVVALIAAFFSFGLVANLAFDMAKIVFFLFLVLAVVAFVAGSLRGRASV